ncbi:MAG: outer membrane beta-barrel protein [Holophagales bacterium]|nr:outer membrane beta-barrel protein [Holophagales bacterium]MXX61376.1 outer membrane beta-barrel protein [Holophagales bacterium]MYC09409.1 outer membrane beta-barrel protein [Holophagales bacterium]MYD24084.1 outer membrane beta-barrel protein [Holophagales bacterium]MYI32297.1 outer membrane beta-barrel protein [Holophagales bacterium]
MRLLGLRLSGLSTILTLLAAVPVAAQNGPYIGFELGIGNGASMVLDGTDNDVATTCDGWIVPIDGTNAGCDPPPSAWSSDIGGGSGMMGGLAVGYRFGNIRAELEYTHSALSYDATADLAATDDVTVDKAQQELEIAETRVETVQYESFFANAYWDFVPGARVSPYVGLGIGTADASIDYFNRWKRNGDPAAITTFAGHPDEESLRRIVAGTTTIANTKLQDSVSAYQLLAGVDFSLSDSVTLGIKARLVEYGDFETGRLHWDQLRSHHSSRGPGGADVTYVMSSDDLSMWGVSFGLKYGF